MRFKRMPTSYESISRIINALYADYDRRAKEIRDGLTDRKLYFELNKVLSSAVDHVCEPDIRKTMLFDLCNDLGYEKSSLALIMSHKTYYERKKAIKTEAARRLGLM